MGKEPCRSVADEQARDPQASHRPHHQQVDSEGVDGIQNGNVGGCFHDVSLDAVGQRAIVGRGELFVQSGFQLAPFLLPERLQLVIRDSSNRSEPATSGRTSSAPSARASR